MKTGKETRPLVHLVDERLRRHWSQQEVADLIGTTPGNVSRWERGLTLPNPYFRQKLCEVFGKSAQELGLLEPPATKSAVNPPEESPLMQNASKHNANPQRGHGALAELALLKGSERSARELLEHVSEGEMALQKVTSPLPEISPEKPSFWRRSLLQRHPTRIFGGLVLVNLLLVVIVLMAFTHTIPFPPGSAQEAHSHPVSATPSLRWHSWPQVLNDALQDTDYGQDWAIDQKSALQSGDGQCSFTPLSHDYQLQTLGPNYCNYGSDIEHSWSDLAYSVEMSIRVGDAGGSILRLKNSNYYYFDISIHGTYALTLHESIGGGQDTILVSGSSAAIHQGLDQWNTLLIVAQGPSFQLWVNDNYLTTITDGTLGQGTIGVAGNYESSGSSAFSEVWFRHTQVWSPVGSD